MTALKKLNDFEERLDTFVDSIFRLFCKKIVHNSVSTESIFTYRPSKEFNAPHKFSITNLATVSSHNKSNPQLVFRLFINYKIFLFKKHLRIIFYFGVTWT